MAEVINMPRLSDTMEEGTVASWLKKVGDKVSEGDILAEIETDKATMEFESFHEGVLLHIGIQEGETAPVDSLLAIIGKKGEDISELVSGGGKSSEKEEASKDDETEKKIIKELISKSDESKVYENKVSTTIEPQGTFHEAEDYHQDYLKKNPGGYNCHLLRPDFPF